MLFFTKDSDLRIDLYTKRIESTGYILVDYDKFGSIHKYEEARMNTMRMLSRKAMNADAPSKYLDMGRESLYHYLTTYKNCPPDAFRSKGVKGFSLNSDRVLAPLLDRGYATEFLKYYISYSSLKSICSRAEGLYRFLEDKGDLGYNGTKLRRLHYSVSQQQNLRFNYNNTDIISIAKEFTSSFTAEDGYLLVWGDFAQSDFRIAYSLFIRDERNAEIMDSCKDKYEGIARVLADFEGVPFDEERFKEQREIIKVNVLETIYGQRNGRTREEKEFVSKFSKYLDTCPRYKDLYTRLSDMTSLGLQIPVTAYFGETQFVPTDPRYPKSAIDKALNTPIQTGTSQIVILTVNAILDMFYSLGYSEEDVNVYMVRHDEPVFKIKKEVLKDAWVFNQASKIIVDNWTPLELNFSYGKYYTEVDEELTREALRSYEENMDKIEVYEPSNEPMEYMPVPEPFVVYVGSVKINEDSSIACIYSRKVNAAKYLLIHSSDPEEIYKTVRAKLIESQNLILDAGYKVGVVVYNTYGKEEIYDQSMFYKFITPHNTFTTFAHLLASYMVYRYCNKYNLPCSIDERSFDRSFDMIRSVGELDVIKE